MSYRRRSWTRNKRLSLSSKSFVPHVGLHPRIMVAKIHNPFHMREYFSALLESILSQVLCRRDFDEGAYSCNNTLRLHSVDCSHCLRGSDICIPVSGSARTALSICFPCICHGHPYLCECHDSVAVSPIAMMYTGILDRN